MSKGKSRKACTSRRTKKRADVEALKKAEEEIKALSRFPAENPDVVMRISRDGDILYCNRAGLPILNEWKCEVGQPVPSGWLQLVADIYRSGIKKEIEEKHGTQTLLMMLVPIVGEGYVNVYGLDITERKKTEERLKRLNSVLSAIRNVNQLIAREKDLDKLLKETCDHLTENLGYYNAFVCLFDEAKKFVSGFESGLGENFPPLVQLFKSGRLTRCAFEAMAQTGVVLIESPSKDCSDCPIAEVYEGKSALSARLGYEDSVYGFITAAAPSSAIHEEVEQRLFEEVAGDIAFALHNIELENARKKAEEALRKAHDELEMRVEERTKELRTASLYARSLIEVSLDPLVTINPQGKINDVNKSTEEVTGFSREQLIGSDFSEYFTDPEEARKSYRRVFADGFVRDYPLAIRHKSGKITEVLYNATVYQNEAGEIQGVFAAARDITERKKAEEALQKAYDELDMRVQERTKDLRQTTEELKAEIIEHQKAEDALLESQKDLNRAQAVAKTGSWRLNVSRNELLWSDETYRMFGIPKGTPMTYEAFLSTVHPDDRDYVDQKWQAALRGEYYDIEHRIVVKGEVKWVRERAELELNKDGQAIGGFGTVEEITELKAMQAKLEEYSKHLEQLVEEKTQKLKEAERLATIGETAGMVGHDIRNPLQSIEGAVYLAKEELKSLPSETQQKKELNEILKIIENQTRYIDNIVADLQDFARTPMVQPRETDIRELTHEALAVVEIPENIQVSTIIQEDLQKLIIDPTCIKRVLINLIENAVQAMPDGGKLSVKAFSSPEAIYITVEDTGSGIAKEDKPKIFTPLYTTKAKGQGLGLPVCKKLVEAHDGEITFESEAGKGTTFKVKLPLSKRAS